LRKHELLRRLHARLQPRSYFEIGVRRGKSLTLSRAQSVGVDPNFVVSFELQCDVHLVRSTSDEFFARSDPFAYLEQPIDLAFIDGMHLAEYALRDLINTERHCHPGTVIVIDDVLPRNVEQAGRARVGDAIGHAWAGDVFKLIEVLRAHRPDLVVLEVDTAPTGTVVILLPDPTDKSLSRMYDALVGDLVTPDPQVVPDEVLRRSRAIAPESLLRAPIWKPLIASRKLDPRAARVALDATFRKAGLTPGVPIR
jgi:Methyltransferase domain